MNLNKTRTEIQKLAEKSYADYIHAISDKDKRFFYQIFDKLIDILNIMEQPITEIMKTTNKKG